MTFELPNDYDKIFRDDIGEWRNDALLDYVTNKLSFYADGYLHGANALVDQCYQDHTLNDILIYPMVFLYRQYIELRLKEIIFGLKYCLGDDPSFPKHHKIDILWKDFKFLYKSIGEENNSDVLNNGGRLINELSQIDPLSMAFRYPVDKDGNDTIKLKRISISNLQSVINKLANLLDAISDQVAYYKDIKNDMYRDWE
ncbi:MAG TPA: hypothetical protein VK167_13070 [Flavipsychrobacter sp.]|nr:hypothetical protein [Flavipsychrobacter sp.]